MSCYICGKEKHSVEHAPAKSFFPTDKRTNLITVDSCEEHNEDTSKDDEYVRNIIVMSISNNDVALNHFLQKCIKSFMRSPALLKSTKTYFIYTLNDVDYLDSLKKEINNSWDLTELEFIDYQTFKNKTFNDSSSFFYN